MPPPDPEATEAPRDAETGPTPIVIPRRMAYALWIGAGLLLLFVLTAVPAVVTIVIGGSALALLLSYPVRLLDIVMPRRLAVIIVLLGTVGVLAFALNVVIPPVASQVTEFVEDLPGLVEDAEDRLRDTARRLERQGYLPADADEVIGDLEAELSNRAADSIEPLLTGLLGRVSGVLELVITTFGILFVGIALLLDADRIRRTLTRAAPEAYHDDLDQLWTDLGASLSRYLGGLIFVAVVQGGLVSAGLYLLDVPYSLVLGVWVAFTSLIPYIGAWLGAIPALILAALVSPLTVLWTFLLYFGVQTFEGNLLTPRVQGEAVRVHPILVLLTVVAVGGLFGIVGVILAIPLLAMARVLFDFFRVRLRLEPREGARPLA